MIDRTSFETTAYCTDEVFLYKYYYYYYFYNNNNNNNYYYYYYNNNYYYYYNTIRHKLFYLSTHF